MYRNIRSCFSVFLSVFLTKTNSKECAFGKNTLKNLKSCLSPRTVLSVFLECMYDGHCVYECQKYEYECRKYTINFQHFWDFRKFLYIFDIFGIFCIFRSFGKFRKRFGSSKPLFYFGSLLAVDNFWLSTSPKYWKFPANAVP